MATDEPTSKGPGLVAEGAEATKYPTSDTIPVSPKTQLRISTAK